MDRVLPRSQEEIVVFGQPLLVTDKEPVRSVIELDIESEALTIIAMVGCVTIDGSDLLVPIIAASLCDDQS